MSWSPFLFYGLAKFKGLHYYAGAHLVFAGSGGVFIRTHLPHYYARARIGVEIIYPSPVFVGHGGNRAQLRCERVLLLGRGRYRVGCEWL